jgi:hypothetical protein
MSLPLTLGMSADLLAVARPSMRLKPATTDPARTLLHHGRLLPRVLDSRGYPRGLVRLPGQVGQYWRADMGQFWIAATPFKSICSLG